MKLAVFEPGSPKPLRLLELDRPARGSLHLRDLSKWLGSRAIDNIDTTARRLDEPLDVLLSLPPDQVSESLDRALVQDVLEIAREHVGGNNLYIVVRRGVEHDTLATHESMSHWLAAVRHGGAAGVLETLDTFEEERWDALHKERERARRWREELLRSHGYGPFRCVFRQSPKPMIFDCGKDGTPVVVVQDLKQISQERFVQRELDNHQELLTAFVSVPPSPKLIERLKEREVPLLRFNGWVELLYFMRAINERPSPVTGQSGHVCGVSLRSNAIFERVERGAEPRLLITNGFHPNVKEGRDYMAAGRDIGHLLYQLPSRTTCEVRWAITCDLLFDLVARSPSLGAWVYLGHGQPDKGHHESTSPFEPTAVERWLNAFRGRGRSLGVAMFSSCYSAETAKRFAEEGAGVAVGFRRAVFPEACRILSKPIVDAALRTGGDPGAILRAFEDGCAKLSTTTYDDSGPVAYHPLLAAR